LDFRHAIGEQLPDASFLRRQLAGGNAILHGTAERKYTDDEDR
jgi:hypothetical protein